MRLSNLAQYAYSLSFFRVIHALFWLSFSRYCEENLPHRIDYNSAFSYDIPLYMYLQKLDFLKFNSFRLVEEKNIHEN